MNIIVRFEGSWEHKTCFEKLGLNSRGEIKSRWRRFDGVFNSSALSSKAQVLRYLRKVWPGTNRTCVVGIGMQLPHMIERGSKIGLPMLSIPAYSYAMMLSPRIVRFGEGAKKVMFTWPADLGLDMISFAVTQIIDHFKKKGVD